MSSRANPELQRRQPQADVELSAAIHPLLQQLYRQRGITDAAQLERGANYLLPPQGLTGIDRAVQLLHQAMSDNCHIMVVGDFDADGATSTALSVLALQQFGAQRVSYLVPNRFEQGYGLSPEVVDLAHARQAQLIFTVDNGISSVSGVERATQLGIPVIITDHHLPGEVLPAAAAMVNPNLSDATFPSKNLAGVGVAFYVMLALRAYLREQGWFTGTPPNLADLLDLVALGTVADVVPLDANNRILVWQGLQRIRAGKCRPGIRALLEVSQRQASRLNASDLGFALGPRLNAAGRLDDMSHGVELLITESEPQARMLAAELDALNQTRKEIEQGMQQEALLICEQLEKQQHLPSGLAFYHPEWHQGVVGIVASRLKERFHRPVIAFAPAGDGTLKGSGRSITGLHLRDVLERLDSQHPGLILKFGGHAMAAGLSLAEEQFPRFRDYFAQLVTEWLDSDALQGVIWSDGELGAQHLNVETAEMLRNAGPWGQSFPEPMFDGEFKLLQQRLVGQKHLKLLLEPVNGGPLIDGIAFNVDLRQWPDPSIQRATLAYKLDVNEYRGQRSAQLLVEHLWPKA
ncbi:single-stranded-DNA-specific exonuclease RecJ [Rosenbergiella nectarea]|uniref:single-stranded-DNA-specific exonuclease RecJ n=1 Tax=Rosenbergiella nectarea TaxID=988801 RepID=UPI001BD99BB1|nr:single-stranded-DNA-specific exonuclease RecJ [Rosenbergiella nectarea]MBT0730316.1 single-stranded-DNA-specific exonuclease RecJ [Rosenbergiella nectarea subsp. apis]